MSDKDLNLKDRREFLIISAAAIAAAMVAPATRLGNATAGAYLAKNFGPSIATRAPGARVVAFFRADGGDWKEVGSAPLCEDGTTVTFDRPVTEKGEFKWLIETDPDGAAVVSEIAFYNPPTTPPRR